MRSLRILLGCAQAPVPDGSAAGRWCYILLRELAARGHRVTAFAALKSAAEMQAVRCCFPGPDYDLRCFTAPAGANFATRLKRLRRPHSYLFSDEMVRQWRDECKRGYDIVHLEETWSAWLEPSAPGDNTVLNIYNLYSQDWVADPGDRWDDRLRRLLTVHTERKLIRRFPALLAVSQRLAGEVARIAPRATVTAVPLTLDLERYRFVPSERRPHGPVVALIGSMDWPSSRSAAERLLTRLWPEIRKKLPQARLQITGRNARVALRQYLGDAGVEIHEDVASTQPYFENATVLLYAPERGTGMKVKVLEAFACGLPVVTTSPGIEGLEIEEGVHATVQETDAGLIKATLDLLGDPMRQEAQRRAARLLMETRYAPAAIIGRLENVYAAILDGHTPSPGRLPAAVAER